MRALHHSSRSSSATYNPRALLRWLLVNLEHTCVLASFVLFLGAFTQFLMGVGADPTEGSGLMQGIYFGIYLIASALVLTKPKALIRYLFAEKYLLLLVALAVLSISWASIPDLTARRSLALVGTTLFGIYLASRYDLDQLLKLICWACIVVVLGSFIVVFMFPEFGIMPGGYDGAWQGVFGHKNTLGRAMAFSVLMFTLHIFRFSRQRWLFTLGLCAALLALIFSQSVTALVVLICGGTILPLLSVLRWRSNLVLAAALFGVILMGFVVTAIWTNAEVLVTAFGRDLTFTGRTELWRLSLEAVGKHPWLGYGYSSFWTGSGESGFIWSRLNWQAPHAHNGGIDMLLNLGTIGLGLFVGSLFVALVNSLRFFRNFKSRIAYLPLTFFAFLLLMNFTENSFLGRNNLFWVLQVTITVWVVAWNKARVATSRNVQAGG